MSQLGERLRAARENQGITLPQAAIETRILQRYLIALEDGDYQHLPGDVYARGFIRNYANYLGLSAEELVELYRLERGITDPIRIVPATSAPRIRGIFIPSFFGVFFVVLAMVGLAYLGLSLTDNISSESVAQAPAPTAAPTPEPLPTWPVEPTTAPAIVEQATADASQPVAGGAPASAPTGAPTPTTQAAPIVGTIRIAGGEHNGSWIRLQTDSETRFQGVLGPGEVRDFTADGDVQIRVGNAGVVYVTINGAEQGPLGSAGQVFNFSWPPR